MTTPIGLGGAANAVIRQQADVAQVRAQIAENSTREAVNRFTHTTTGVGQIVMQQPISFDCVFTEEPSFTSGVALVKSPDPAHYRFPLVTAGVYRWVKKPQKPKPPSEILLATFVPGTGQSSTPPQVEDKSPQFYTGAYLYFIVRADPTQNVRSDGSNLAQLQQAFTDADLAQRAGLTKLIKEAQEALYLNANPPQITIHHHLVFSGNAMKKLSDAVIKLADDMHATPADPPVTSGLAR